jgi:hypothetical protein
MAHESIQRLGMSCTISSNSWLCADISAGEQFIAANKRYNLLSNNCQHLTENLIKELCNGRMISQAKLEEEIRLVSPKIARDLMVARLRSKMEKGEQTEDSESVQHDVLTIKELWARAKH